MEPNEREAFTSVLFAYERLWLTAMKYRYHVEHPNADLAKVNEKYVERGHGLFHPLIKAVDAGQPLQELIRELLQVVDRPLQ